MQKVNEEQNLGVPRVETKPSLELKAAPVDEHGDYSGPLDCAMCGAPNSFMISPLDPAVGYCFKEQKAWRIKSLTCATEGCLRAKATFGDHCMPCLENRVNGQVTSDESGTQY